MIFVTVGTQLPFARLIDAMEAIAASGSEEIVAQTGPAAMAGHWQHLQIETRLDPERFEALFAGARLVVGHAGIGTILTARRLARPLVVLPRRHALGEHRNDHQLATARQVADLPGIHVAWETADLAALVAAPDLAPASEAPSLARSALITRLQAEIGT